MESSTSAVLFSSSRMDGFPLRMRCGIYFVPLERGFIFMLSIHIFIKKSDDDHCKERVVKNDRWSDLFRTN